MALSLTPGSVTIIGPGQFTDTLRSNFFKVLNESEVDDHRNVSGTITVGLCEVRIVSHV